MAVTAPYRYVELPPYIQRHPTGYISHDKPHGAGYCGNIPIIITVKTPLCVGGEQTASANGQPALTHFFRGPDGHPAIPGSSLRGMLRSVFEIATFSRFNFVDDRRYSVRKTMHDGYRKHFQDRQPNGDTVSPVIGGLLKAGPDGQWHVRLQTLCRMKITDLPAGAGNWTIENQGYQRLAAWQGAERAAAGEAPLVAVGEPFDDSMALPNNTLRHFKRVVPQEDGPRQAHLVFTGDMNQKTYEYAFLDTGHSTTIDDSLRDAFLAAEETRAASAHDRNEDTPWGHWKRQLNAGHTIPVFMLMEEGRAKQIGLSGVFALISDSSVHEAMGRAQSGWRSPVASSKRKNKLPIDLDWAEGLFGRIDAEAAVDDANHPIIKSRVNASLARLEGDVQPKFETPAGVLLGPHGSWGNATLVPDNSGDASHWFDEQPKAKGFRRYIPRNDAAVPASPPSTGLHLLRKLETVPPGTVFHARLRLHNVTEEEIGALLWCLSFGNNPAGRWHGLGTGKPWGFGGVEITLPDDALAALRRNMPDRQNKRVAPNRSALIGKFITAMGSGWMGSPTIRGLQSHAEPRTVATGLEPMAAQAFNALGNVKTPLA